jgi:ATP-dependent Clp protease, protease subunit
MEIINNNTEKNLKELFENLGSGNKFDNKFLAERKIFLWGPVMDYSAKYITERLMFLESESDKEITFYINSPGGSVTAGMIIYDVMQMMKSPVSTVCIGLAASMGSLLLSGGTKGRRFIYPSGQVMIHQPSIGGYMQGQASDIAITANEIIKTKKMGAEILAKNCGQTYEKIMADFDRDYWMEAQESVDYGIVDGIISKV